MASCQKFKGAAKVHGSFRTLGNLLSAFESYQLGVVSTAMCLQDELLDYRTGETAGAVRNCRISSDLAATSACPSAIKARMKPGSNSK